MRWAVSTNRFNLGKKCDIFGSIRYDENEVVQHDVRCSLALSIAHSQGVMLKVMVDAFAQTHTLSQTHTHTHQDRTQNMTLLPTTTRVLTTNSSTLLLPARHRH